MLVPRTPNAEHHSFSLLQARSVASRTRHKANSSLGAASSSTLWPRRATPRARCSREGREAISHSRSPILVYNHNCACARPWINGLVQEATSVTMSLAPPFCARGGGGSRQRGNSLPTPLLTFAMESQVTQMKSWIAQSNIFPHSYTCDIF